MTMVKAAPLHSLKFHVVMRSLLNPSLLLLDQKAVMMMKEARNHVDVRFLLPLLEALQVDLLRDLLALHLLDVVLHLDHQREPRRRRL